MMIIAPKAKSIQYPINHCVSIRSICYSMAGEMKMTTNIMT